MVALHEATQPPLRKTAVSIISWSGTSYVVSSTPESPTYKGDCWCLYHLRRVCGLELDFAAQSSVAEAVPADDPSGGCGERLEIVQNVCRLSSHNLTYSWRSTSYFSSYHSLELSDDREIAYPVLELTSPLVVHTNQTCSGRGTSVPPPRLALNSLWADATIFLTQHRNAFNGRPSGTGPPQRSGSHHSNLRVSYSGYPSTSSRWQEVVSLIWPEWRRRCRE